MHKFQPLSNGEVDILLQNVKYFKGTFPKDQFKGKIKPHEYGVINLDDSTGSGTHFTAYANIPNSQFVYYFDSYGVVPSTNIEKYLKSSGKIIAYSNAQIQDIGSVICGYYCILFIMSMAKGIQFHDFLSQFGDNYKKNDEMVKKWAIKNKMVK